MALTLSDKKPKPVYEPKRGEMIEKHLYLVRHIAGKMAIFLPPHIETEDLTHYGILGLIDAVDKFQPEKGVKFPTYASNRIRGTILDFLRSMDWIPRGLRKKIKKIERTTESLEQKLCRTPKKEEIAEKLAIPVEEIYETLAAVNESNLFSFEELQTFSDKFEFSTSSQYEDKNCDGCQVYIKKEKIGSVREAIGFLSDREKLILALYYTEDLTLKEIKYILGLSEARISQIHTGALKKLRERLKSQY